MRTPAAAIRPKPRKSQPFTFPAPTRGWIANENLADPTQGGAAVLENWFPTATGLKVREGSELYATLGAGNNAVRSLFSYLNGTNERLFAADDSTIYDVTTVPAPDNWLFVDDQGDYLVTDEGDTIGTFLSTIGLEVLEGMTSGDWVVVQFATSGGVFLVGVNGQDDGFIFDGEFFYPLSSAAVSRLEYDGEAAPFTVGQTLTGATSGATGTIIRVVDNGTTGTLILSGVAGGPFTNNEAITDGAGGAALANGDSFAVFGAFTGIATSSLSYVWVYKQRLWFVEKESLNAWYLPVDQISGAAVKFPLGPVFGRGGSLLFGQTWSLESGAEGGLSEQNTFTSTEGEVAVYQGIDPAATDGSWSKVGVYRIGRPLGNKAFIRAGGDLVISTDIGFIPLSQAIQKDVAALSPAAVSFPIETAWNDRVAERGSLPWQCEIWPTKQMSVIALPTATNSRPEMLITNARTGAWALYTGWDGNCIELFKERLFFGSKAGKVIEAGVSGADQGIPYTATVVPLFSDLGAAASLKIVGMARAVLLSPFPVNDTLSIQVDFTLNLPAPPDSEPISGVSVWGAGVWGQSEWGGAIAKQAFQIWRSVYGSGYSAAPALQITSGNIPPPDVDLVKIDVTFQTAEIVS